MATNCGCEIEKDFTPDEDGRVRGYRIIYCSLHHEAEALRTAAEGALRELARVYRDQDWCTDEVPGLSEAIARSWGMQ